MPSHLRLCVCASFLLFLCPVPSRAEKLQITTEPSGATVEINGVEEGATPFEKDFPGGYFHKPRTSLGSRLEHPIVVRLSLAGYSTREMTLTEGPMNWISLNGHNHGEYWLLKSNHFHINLQRIAETFTGGITATVSTGNAQLALELSLEELVSRAKPAVVCLKGLDKAGSGFFVTETGVIATNAHVARGEETLLALLPGGQQLEARVVYIDADLDIALAKVSGQNFPHLTLADATAVRAGQSVLAIGNPGDAMLFSATKGIVSAVGKFPNAGPGTWIQTDAPINPGNSGGPLLNARGEVVGINTQKLVKKNVSGIGFALSAGDLLEVLRRFYPLTTAAAPLSASSPPLAPPPDAEKLAAPAPGEESGAPSPPPSGFGTVILTEPQGAEIWIDQEFVGSVPATLKLAAGKHVIVLKVRGHPDCTRTLNLLKGSKVSLGPCAEPST